MSSGQLMVVLIVTIACIAGVLKERIAVLERIATDRSTSLDHEIEQLRDR